MKQTNESDKSIQHNKLKNNKSYFEILINAIMYVKDTKITHFDHLFCLILMFIAGKLQSHPNQVFFLGTYQMVLTLFDTLFMKHLLFVSRYCHLL